MLDNFAENSAPVRVLCVIPARLHSQRLPRKMLRVIAGKPLVGWTFEAASACALLDRVLIAVDAQETAQVCEAFEWPFRMTSPMLASGTDRLHAISREIQAEIYVNIQGDEPLVRPQHIAALLAPFEQAHVDVTTLSVDCPLAEEHNPNTVKVVTAADGRALYFSRAAIPHDRDVRGTTLRKHLGLYAYRHSALERFAALPQSRLESLEKLEQLRLLENGMALYVTHVADGTIGVDTEEDLLAVQKILARNGRLDDEPRS